MYLPEPGFHCYCIRDVNAAGAGHEEAAVLQDVLPQVRGLSYQRGASAHQGARDVQRLPSLSHCKFRIFFSLFLGYTIKIQKNKCMKSECTKCINANDFEGKKCLIWIRFTIFFKYKFYLPDSDPFLV